MMEVSVTSVLKGGAFPISGARRRLEYGKVFNKIIPTSADVHHSLMLILTGGEIGGDAFAELIVQFRVECSSVHGLWT